MMMYAVIQKGFVPNEEVLVGIFLMKYDADSCIKGQTKP